MGVDGNKIASGNVGSVLAEETDQMSIKVFLVLKMRRGVL